jgi:aminoglycoside 6-adenylyltransferase
MNSGEEAVVDRLIRWADSEPLVRALLLTGSRAERNAQRDALSDYDVIVLASEIGPFTSDDSWLQAYGGVLVSTHNSYPCCGIDVQTRLTLYEDGTKIDYSLWSTMFLKEVSRQPQPPDVLDFGYRVLVDKDNLAADLKPPTHTAHIPRKPNEAEFRALVEEFWLETSYVAKNLSRGELLPAKYSFDAVIKFNLLRRMLEWRVELDHDWSLRLGFMGRGLKTMLRPEALAQLESTFVGAQTEGNWRALFETVDLFRTTARAVAEGLGYSYPEEADRGVMTYLNGIKDIERSG